MAGTEAKAFSGTDDKYVQINEEQEAKALQDATQGAGTKDGPRKRKDKRTPWDLALKRSIKGEPKGLPSIFPHVNSAFTETIVCECTTIIYPGTDA